MKTTIYLILSTLFLFYQSSCNVHKQSTTSSNNIPAQNTTSATTTSKPITPTYNDSLGLLVSFYSIGEGIDLVTNKEFVNFLNSYTGKITYQTTRQGREGEVDYCIKINKLIASEQDTFIKKSKEILQKSTLVHVSENAPCVQKD